MLPPGSTIAFYGDSITTGWRSISAPDKRWTARVCAEYGWTERNFARGGMGFVRWRGERPSENEPREHTADRIGLLAEVLASDADACVVALGCNDSVLINEDRRTGSTRWTTEIRRAIERDLDLLLERFGRARVAVFDLYQLFPLEDLGLPTDGSALPPGWRGVQAEIAAACADRGILPLDAVATDLYRRGMYGEDGIHPNDAGHAALADALGPRLCTHFAAD
ncbi:SGNH/GDSL hydrolase family protein [Microbacterium sp. KR10-403]|uniref:SGNH/GDSL hydrolase family protein n=1 Tax=Microbacterium sp. KR10-403 TaxID=3158581 RepID=UPI0032E4056D